MAWFVIGLILMVLGFIGLGFKVVEVEGRDRYGDKRMVEKVAWGLNKKQLLCFLALILVSLSFFVSVPANSVGIIYSPLNGGVQDETLGEGLHTKAPWDVVYFISSEVQTKHIDGLYGQTKDSQYLTISVDVKYYIDKSLSYDVFKKFKTLDRVNSELVMPAVQRAIEDATTSYNIIEVLGSERSAVYSVIEQSLSERLSKDGITLHSITFLDTDGGDAIEAAIQNEAVAKKAVETAEQERLKAEIDAETRIIAAEAQATEKEILAAAVAENPEVLELEWIQRWNGVLPIYVGGDSAGVMLDLTDLGE